AVAHHPSVLVLDEPLNGLDPMARAESIALFEAIAKQGMHVIISSHILEEVDRISDRVVLVSSGYVVAEGQIREVRKEVRDHPMQILVRCSNAARLAAAAFELDHVVEAKILNDGQGVMVARSLSLCATSFAGTCLRTAGLGSSSSLGFPCSSS